MSRPITTSVILTFKSQSQLFFTSSIEKVKFATPEMLRDEVFSVFQSRKVQIIDLKTNEISNDVRLMQDVVKLSMQIVDESHQISNRHWFIEENGKIYLDNGEIL